MASSHSSPEARAFLRHTLATLAYRCGKVVRDAPDAVGTYRASDSTRMPVEILAHIGDLLEWGWNLARGNRVWNTATPGTWGEEVERFYANLLRFDAYLASDEALHEEAEKLFQGPVADALTHTGQLAMLRRMARSPVRGENYFLADIVAGRTGREQAPPRYEFE